MIDGNHHPISISQVQVVVNTILFGKVNIAGCDVQIVRILHFVHINQEKVSGRGVHQATFQNVGFRDWKNAKDAKRCALQLHEATETHKNATIKAAAFKDIAAGKTKDIHSSLSKAYEEQFKKNQKIMLSIIDMVVVLGQRNIPFRGHGWSRELKKRRWKFRFFLALKITV